ENKAVLADATVNEDFEIRGGDVLFSRANTVDLVGATVLVPDSVRPQLLLSDKSVRLVPKNGVNPAWLQFALSAPSIRQQLSEKSTGVKESMRNISQGSLKSVVVRLPPLVDQDLLVERIRTVLVETEAIGDA